MTKKISIYLPKNYFMTYQIRMNINLNSDVVIRFARTKFNTVFLQGLFKFDLSLFENTFQLKLVSCRNQLIYLLCKSFEWLLYNTLLLKGVSEQTLIYDEQRSSIPLYTYFIFHSFFFSHSFIKFFYS